MTTIVRLSTDTYQAELAPGLGGSLCTFQWRHPAHGWLHLMRPLAEGLAAPKPSDFASFPLIPFANRVRGSRFKFRGREIVLPPPPSGRHALHGHALAMPWEVVEAAPDNVWMRYRHVPDAWPYAYEVSQTVAMSPAGMTFRLEAVNTGREAMPYGCGLHPYFPRTPTCTVRAEVGGLWQVDRDVLPTVHGAPDGPLDPRQGLRVDSVVCDNVFTGWNGSAEITWPEQAARLTMTASPNMRALYLYVPKAESYFCLEPATNVTDAFNQAAQGATDTGMIVLEPGAMAVAEVTFAASAL